MVIKLVYTQELESSPVLKKQLLKADEDLESFEIAYRRIDDDCKKFYEDGKRYFDSFDKLIGSMEYLQFEFDENCECYTKQTLKELSSLLCKQKQEKEEILNKVHKEISVKVSGFLDEDLRHVKEARKKFKHTSDELDVALHRNADISKRKPQQCQESALSVASLRSAFSANGVDYIDKINRFYLLKNSVTLDIIQNYLSSLNSYYKTGRDLIKYQKEESIQIKTRISQIQSENIVQFSVDPRDPGDVSTRLAGYLFKRSQTNKFKKWTRRWFVLNNSGIFYQSKSEFNEYKALEIDLRVSKTKLIEDQDRRFQFEIISPNCRIKLQADSQVVCDAWINGINNVFNEALLNMNNASLRYKFDIELPKLVNFKYKYKNKLKKFKIPGFNL